MIGSRIGVAVVCLAALAVPAFGQTAGQYAPELDCKAWLNAGKDFQWSQLEGRVVLLERWSTG